MIGTRLQTNRSGCRGRGRIPILRVVGRQYACAMDPVAIGFATTGVTLLVSVGLFALDRTLKIRADRREVRRQLMVRVLDTLELATRSLVRPAFVQAWTNSDVEYALLLPRLLLDLGRRDRAIAAWVHSRVQLMQLQASPKSALAIRADVAGKLLEWQQGELNLAWFEGQLGLDPPVHGFKVPLRVKIARLGHDGWAWTQLLCVVAGVAAMIRQSVKS